MQKVLFICTGNFFRSRLAEILFNFYAASVKVEWEAESRGLTGTGALAGLSNDAANYLEKRGLKVLIETPKDPEVIRVSDLEESQAIVALNRTEHEGLMREKFGQIPKILESQGRLRYWNVCDIPDDSGGIGRLFGPKVSRPSQPSSSSTEHIDFAVRSLFQELTGVQPALSAEVSEELSSPK